VIYFYFLIWIAYFLTILATAYFYASMERNHIIGEKIGASSSGYINLTIHVLSP